MMKETTEKSKGKSYLPFLAIVAVVAIVAIVVLVMNYGKGSSAVVVDEEGNVVGEAWSKSNLTTEPAFSSPSRLMTLTTDREKCLYGCLTGGGCRPDSGKIDIFTCDGGLVSRCLSQCK